MQRRRTSEGEAERKGFFRHFQLSQWWAKRKVSGYWPRQRRRM